MKAPRAVVGEALHSKRARLVERRQGDGAQRFECEDGSVEWLTTFRCLGAHVGDEGLMEYRTWGSGCLWFFVPDVHLVWMDYADQRTKTFCGRPARSFDAHRSRDVTCRRCLDVPIPAALLKPDGTAAGEDA